MKFRLMVPLLLLTHTALAQYDTERTQFIPKKQPEFEDGKDYFSYTVPIKGEGSNERKTHLLSFFDYDCRVCVNTQDILALYSQINPNNVVVEEYPVATEETSFSARVYYSLQQMGHGDVSDSLLFETANPVRYRELSKYENLLAWLSEQNVDIERFNDVYSSEETARKIEQAVAMTEKYGVFTYPFVVIDGKYVLTNSTLYDDDYTFAVLDFLVHKLTSKRPKANYQIKKK